MLKIIITGPESSGKTALCKALSKHFKIPYTEEYAREYLNNLGREYKKEDLKQRVLHNLNGKGFSELIQANANPENSKDKIVITKELTPSQFIETNWENCLGIVLIKNSPNSHVAILAKSKGIPMLTGADLDLHRINSNATVILDCVKGDLILEPNRETVGIYKTKISKYRQKKDYEKTLI